MVFIVGGEQIMESDNKVQLTTIAISKETKKELDNLKIHSRESCDSIVTRLVRDEKNRRGEPV